jgi:hypothetical protein
MPQSNAQRAVNDDSIPSANRPVAKYKHGGVELAVWTNQAEGGTMFNTTISNSFRDEKSGEWKTTTSYSPTDLLVVAELAHQAFAEIIRLKQQNRKT